MRAISMGIAKGDEHEEFSIESDWGLHGKAYGKEEADLFAAAPELLDAVKQLVAYVESKNIGCVQFHELIARAEGKEF